MMAEDAIKEQIYTIPLRDVKRLPRNQRSRKAVSVVRKYLGRHMKVDVDDVKIDKTINEKIWERGYQKPPSRIRVRAMKFEDDTVETELA